MQTVADAALPDAGSNRTTKVSLLSAGMINNAYGNNSYGNNNNPALQAQGQPNQPPVESLAMRAANLNDEIASLNNRLAQIRGTLFGEAEASKDPDRGSPTNTPMPSLQCSVEFAQQQLQIAGGQISSIINRL